MIKIDAIANQCKIKNWHPQLRINATLLLLVTSIFWDHAQLYTALFISASLCVLMTTSLTPKSFSKLLGIPMGFILLSLVVIAVTPESDRALLKLWKLPLYITEETLALCMKVFIRSLSSVTLIFSLSLTVPMQHLIRWMKRLKMPDAFIELFVLSYRFIFILIEEAQDMLIAQEMRFGYFHLTNAVKTVNQLGASLFIRAFARFEDLNQAMALRFYDEG